MNPTQPTTHVRIGTRSSALALAQAELVAEQLRLLQAACELVPIASDGDRDKTTPLSQLGGRGVFATSLQQALHENRIDVAVHSAKDLPTVRPSGLTIAAILAREDPRDVLVSRHATTLKRLPPDPLIGTSSQRRVVQVLKVRPDARIVDLRGNIDTRIHKALETELDGIVIAAAGLHRLGWHDRITEYLDPDVFVPAPGQGALAVEVRSSDRAMIRLTGQLDDRLTHEAVNLERAFLGAIGAGCTTPVGARAEVRAKERVVISAMMASDDGNRVIWKSTGFARGSAAAAVIVLAQAMHQEVADPVAESAPPPLLGRTVLITRDVNEDDPLARSIRAAGGIPIISHSIKVVAESLDSAGMEIVSRYGQGTYSWIAFTSQHAVTQFRSALAAAGLKPWNAVRCAVVGPETASAARAAGFDVDLEAPLGNATSLGNELVGRTGPVGQVLFPTGSRARPEFPAIVRAAGGEVTELVLYSTVPAGDVDPLLRRNLERGDVDAVTFMSPSAVDGLRAQCGDSWPWACSVPAVCIGETTAMHARALGMLNVSSVTDRRSSSIVTRLCEVLAATKSPVILESSCQ